jgi:hypothetical protein
MIAMVSLPSNAVFVPLWTPQARVSAQRATIHLTTTTRPQRVGQR